MTAIGISREALTESPDILLAAAGELTKPFVIERCPGHPNQALDGDAEACFIHLVEVNVDDIMTWRSR